MLLPQKTGTGINQITGNTEPLNEIAKSYHEANKAWIAIGDENYGEGSSREHAAMEPRFRNCKAVLVRSFARIAETNLKKQGVLPLTFANSSDYDLIDSDDLVSITGLAKLAPKEPVDIVLTKADGTKTTFAANHTLSAQQIEWFKAGSALNLIKEKQKQQ